MFSMDIFTLRYTLYEGLRVLDHHIYTKIYTIYEGIYGLSVDILHQDIQYTMDGLRVSGKGGFFSKKSLLSPPKKIPPLPGGLLQKRPGGCTKKTPPAPLPPAETPSKGNKRDLSYLHSLK